MARVPPDGFPSGGSGCRETGFADGKLHKCGFTPHRETP